MGGTVYGVEHHGGERAMVSELLDPQEVSLFIKTFWPWTKELIINTVKNELPGGSGTSEMTWIWRFDDLTDAGTMT